MLVIGKSKEEDYKTGLCLDCNVRDTSQHAALECGKVREIWEGAVSWLQALIGRPTTLEVDLTITEVILGFPQLRNSLPKAMRMRVVLWHSAVVFTIAKLRERSLEAARTGDEGIHYDFSGWREVLGKEIWRILTDIKEGMVKDERDFRELWIEGNELAELVDGKLVYHTR